MLFCLPWKQCVSIAQATEEIEFSFIKTISVPFLENKLTFYNHFMTMYML